MKKRTVAAVAATTLGLTLLGAGAAVAAGDNAPEWAPQMGQHQTLGNGAGHAYGDGTGDPTTCPYYDGTGDQVQEQLRLRERIHVQDQSKLQDQTQLQDRTGDQTQQRDRAQLHKVS